VPPRVRSASEKKAHQKCRLKNRNIMGRNEVWFFDEKLPQRPHFFKHKDTKTTFFNAENAKKNAKDTEIFLIVFFTPFRDSNPDRGRYPTQQRAFAAVIHQSTFINHPSKGGRYPTQQRAFAAVNHHSTINNHHSKAVHSSFNNNQSSFEKGKLPRRGYTFVARGKRPQGSATPG